MSNDGRTSNETGLSSKLKRTLTLPLPRKKSGGPKFLVESARQGRKSSQRNENGSSSRRVARTLSRNGIRTKNSESEDVTDESYQETLSRSSVSGDSRSESSATKDAVEAASDSGKNGKKRRYRRWHSDALAKFKDVRKLLSGSKKNISISDVLKTVTLNRNPSEILGICIKEIERSVTPENRSNSDVRQSSVIVSRLISGGIAEKYGTLQKGDEIVLVNNRDVSQLTIKEVAALMDCHKHLVLTIRSGANHSNNNNISDSDQEDSIALVQRVCHDIFEENLNTPESTSESVAANKTVREHPIPSIYDNNIPALLDPILSKLNDKASGSEKQALETEYNEALHILLDAIKSFENPRRTPQSIMSAVAENTGSDLWGAASPENSQENSPSGLTDTANRGTLSTTPHFPSSLDLPDIPVFPLLQTEVSISEEIQVDGMSQKCKSYRRSHSFSTYPSESTHSNNKFTAHTPSLRENRHRFIGKLSRSGSRRTSDNKIDEIECRDGGKSASQSMQSDLDNQRPTTPRPHAAAQLEQCSGRGDGTTENISECENTDVNTGSISSLAVENQIKRQNGSQQDLKTPSRSPDENSTNNLFQIEHSSGFAPNTTAETTASTPGPKTIWDRIGSPPSLRKKARKTFKSFAKKKPGSSADWDSIDSTQDTSVREESSVAEQYNSESAEAHRLSSYFIPRNGQPGHTGKALDLSEFKKHKQPAGNIGKYSFSSSQNPIKGSLVITLYGARDLKKVLSGVYCICQIDDDLKHRIKTSMRHCNGSVAWNECYEAKLEEANDLYLSLYAWESENQHKELGKARLPISELMSDQLGVALRLAVKLEPRGTIYVKLSLEDSSKLEGPRVFGADLQSILDREKSGLPIPLLVRDCIREVEQRGMAIVGIYRLCGSAIAKRELRAKYEMDSTKVDLCPDQYPDVNVITGILKDFLRELPQPLLPPELLEAVTQCMGDYADASDDSNLLSTFDVATNGHDAETSAKRHSSVMLRLVEIEKRVSLPPAEKATLYALLNHLKRISANHERNKMTCQNLAVCFGPVLLGSVNSPPAKGLDLNAAIGFKQHIQVLNFMVSNWPAEPVRLSDFETASTTANKTGENSESGHASASHRISTVSLTRRISWFPQGMDDTDDTDGEMLDVEPFYHGDNFVFRHSQRSGSLTDILESNIDGTGEDGDFDTEV